ncbi:hypothetical protein A0O34_21700 [Chryseobacterium glaciei]|uniref:DUF3828 domain-containing protein n=1 Tax=Chryseobacterium glaciei TaxID=1685010 RepID=A0A172Y140_9FLAO|nr:hypothetical protein [Chryseobacterium glaciei]ANF52978.1 hypothetical protein A0O34_21700 [Chryseobacterium glaciei]
MKPFKYISVILILLSISSCVNQQKKDEDQIKNTVRAYWKAVKNNDLQAYNNLIYESQNYPGVTASELNFLYKHYDIVNPKESLLKNIKIKDTTVMFAENKQKYVQYTIVKKNDPDNLKKDLIITLMFYKPIGFNKINNPVILENHIGWDKD